MIQIDEELWEMYHGSSVPKQLYIVFPNITLDNSKIFDFSMEESLSSDTDMLFGSCEATQFRARVECVGKDIVGQKCQIYHIVAEKYRMPLGTYIIDSVSKKDDLGYREIIGYDEIYTKLDTDVTAWYKSLSFPMSLMTLGQSLFAYVGIPIIEQELILDNLQIERTIEPQVLNGRDVAQAIGELNGTFGHVGRDGKFKYVHLGSAGLYPAEDLYPSEELFPAEADSIFESSTVFSCTREEYEVAGIDCLQIRQEEGDVGSVIYDTIKYTNPYIVTGNFLVYGKTAAQLEEIGRTLFNYIKNTPYTPYTAKIIGLPYLEVGDGITFTTKKDNFLSFVMKRKLSGIQSLKDELSATGNQQRDNEVSPNMEIEMLKGRATVIQKSVEGIKVTVTDLEADTNSKFEQTANRITAEVANINQDMSSRFQITNDAITAEVQRATGAEGQLSSRINVTESNITAEVKRAKDAEGALSGRITLTESSLKTEISNTAAGLNSTISQTATTINTRITNEVNGLNSTISQTANSITTEVRDLSGNFTKLEQTVNGWTFVNDKGETVINGNSIQSGHIKGAIVTTDWVDIGEYGVFFTEIYTENNEEIYYSTGSIMPMAADDYGNEHVLMYSGGTLEFGNHAGEPYYWLNDFYDVYTGSGVYTERHIFKEKARFINNIVTSRMALGDESTALYASERGIETQSSISSNGNLICTGTKNRAVETKDYGVVLMNTLETTGAYFSDIGSGTIIDGSCYIHIDSKFEEVIDSKSEYHVLITQTSNGRIDYTKKEDGYFVVYGSDGTAFDWIIIARQKDYQGERMETGEVIEDNEIQIDESIFRKDYAPAHISEKYADELDYDLATDAIKYINEINNKEKKIMEVFV